MKTLFKFITFFLAATLSIPAAAQANVKFPPGLKWQMMPAVYFNFYQKKGTAAQKAAAQKIWASKISAKDPAFVLIDKVVTADSEYTFTMLDRPGGDCLPPAFRHGGGQRELGDAQRSAKHRIERCIGQHAVQFERRQRGRQ